MLWYKGWLETRLRLLVALGAVGLWLFAFSPIGFKAQIGFEAGTRAIWAIVTLIAVMLAGAGIVTQSPFQAARGLHGSTLFTLSLPVSRFRLLAVRAGLGWLEMAGLIGAMCGGMWVVFPALRHASPPEEVFGYGVALIACSTGVYAIGVLLATFLDDQWRVFGSILGVMALAWLFKHTPLPASVNFFLAMGDGSPLIAHTMPWLAMAFSLGLATVLFFAALKVVQRREY